MSSDCFSLPTMGLTAVSISARITGTGAVVTVLTLLGKVSGRNVRVRMDGGELAVDAEAHDGRIENLYLTGPAALVCAGEILDKTILDLIKKQEEKA